MAKLCIDCKYCKSTSEKYQNLHCFHPSLAKTTCFTLVDGSVETFPCATSREFESLCGKEGNLFEKKTGSIDKLITWFRT